MAGKRGEGLSGTSDLTVRSIEWVGQPTVFRFSLEAPWNRAGGSSLPPPRVSTNEPLVGVIERSADIGMVSTNSAVLRVTTDSPSSRARDPSVMATVLPARLAAPAEPHIEVSEQTWLSVIIRRLVEGEGHSASATSVRRQDALTEPEEFVLRLDPQRSPSLTTEVPEYLGGGSVTIDRFEGEVRFQARPDPSDVGVLALTVLRGQFTAPSSFLPRGIASEPTTLTFGDPALRSGRPDLATGEYTAEASATIVNNLFPNGLPVRGFYSGVVDAVSSRASLRCFSLDRVPWTEGLEVIRNGDGDVVTWMSNSRLAGLPSGGRLQGGPGPESATIPRLLHCVPGRAPP